MENKNLLLVTGGAGFIGSNFILQMLKYQPDVAIINLDKLTYAGNRANLAAVEADSRYTFVHGDICDRALLKRLFDDYSPNAVVHFAAESHVDRSIHAPAPFIETNVVGTCALLDAALAYWKERGSEVFKFLHVSTDEVYGSLDHLEPPSVEESSFAPNSPYAASKAGGDCLARSYSRTYGLPVIITRSSNNFGPYQFPEKLIPLTILNALTEKTIPIYGDGLQIRNWLYVEDHCHALRLILQNGTAGESYNIGGDGEVANIDVVSSVCKAVGAGKALISHVEDRLGHDRRYSLDSSKLRQELGWRPSAPFSENIDKTVSWYLEHRRWLLPLADEEYKQWLKANYGGVL